MDSSRDSDLAGVQNKDWNKLIKRAALGEQSALAAFYDSTSRLIFSLILRILRDLCTAEEVLLDVYTQAWKQASTFDSDRETPLAWLLAIASTRALLVHKFEHAVGDLGLASGEEAPAEFLRDLVLARVEREEQLSPPTPPAPTELGPQFSAVRPRPASSRSSLAWILVAGFALAALATFELWREGRIEIQKHDEVVSAMQVEANRLKGDLEREKSNSREYDLLKLALNSPGSKVILLSGQPPAETSSAQVYWDVRNNRWFVAAHLPPSPARKVYQLWLVTSRAKISAGFIKTDVSGRGFAIIELPKDLSALAAAAITLEPEGGSAQPTMPIYVLGRIG